MLSVKGSMLGANLAEMQTKQQRLISSNVFIDITLQFQKVYVKTKAFLDLKQDNHAIKRIQNKNEEERRIVAFGDRIEAGAKIMCSLHFTFIVLRLEILVILLAVS